MTEKLEILTDLDQGIWRDSFHWSTDDRIRLRDAAEWSITKRTLRGGVSDGIDVVSLNNGVLAVDVLPTRGMGLWRGLHRGTRLGWDSPARHPVHPAFVNGAEQQGLGWLAGFNEWLCRCGLSSIGEPGIDFVDDGQGKRVETQLYLHGRIANTPCHHVSVRVDDAGPGTISLRGVMNEASFYGPKLRLESTVQMLAGRSSLSIVDEVTNCSDEPAELQLLYHTNIGPPLLEEGSQLIAATKEVAPYDVNAACAVDDWARFQGPTPGYSQLCYFMNPISDVDCRASVLFCNRAREKGLKLVFDSRELPCFTLWKNLQGAGDGYVVGLEPGTSFPNFKSFERNRNRVIVLAPGERYRSSIEIQIYDGREEVSAAASRIERLRDQEPTLLRHIVPSYSPADGNKT